MDSPGCPRWTRFWRSRSWWTWRLLSAQKATRETPEQWDHKGQPDLRDLKLTLGLRDPQGQQDPPALKEQRDQRELPDRRDRQGQRDLPGLKVTLDLKEQQGRRELPDHRVTPGLKGQQEPQDRRVQDQAHG